MSVYSSRSSQFRRCASRRCVLEAELEDQGTELSLPGVVLEPLAPVAERQASKRGVVLVPLGYHLPELEVPELLHLHRGVLLQL